MANLPDYDRPPVVEVALSVLFEPPDQLRSLHAGLFWGRVRDRFPVIEEHPLLPPLTESESEPGLPLDQIRVELISSPRMPRFFLVSEDGQEMIQLQRDRIGHNWRRTEESSSYPRYREIRREFADELREFDAFLTEEKLGSLAPVQCELTYVNRVDCEASSRPLGSPGRILDILKTDDWNVVGHQLEWARVNAAFGLSHDSEGFVGRLHVSLSPEPDGAAPAHYNLNLTSRGQPIGHGVDGALAFLDFAHERTVMAFSEILSAELQAEWGRK